MMHDKILRDLRTTLDELEKKDRAAYIEVEKDLLSVNGKAIYKLELAKYKAKTKPK